MMKMKSKKSHPNWWDSSLLDPTNFNSKWLQDNLQEMNQNVRRMLKLIEDDADSFVKKVEMYYQKRQELINLVEKCYRIHCSLVEQYSRPATGELSKSIPSDLRLQGRGLSSVASTKTSTQLSPPPKTTFNSGSKQLKRVTSVKWSTDYKRGKSPRRPSAISTRADEEILVRESESNLLVNYLNPQSDNDSKELHDGTDELEVELRDMIEKLYILHEEKRVVAKLQDRVSRYKDDTPVYDGELREVKISVSDVDEALLEENLELKGEITRLWKERLYMEDYIKGTKKRCESLDQVLSQVIARSEVERLRLSIVRKENNNVEKLNRSLGTLISNYDVVVAERDQLKARVAMLDADISSKDDQIDKMNERLNQNHVQRVELITETEEMVEKLILRVQDLENEVAKQEEIVSEATDEKGSFTSL